MKSVFPLICFVFILSGCTSLPKLLNAKTIPLDRFYPTLTNDQNSPPTVVVIRDNSMSGGACFYALFVDDKLIARIGTLERANLLLPIGSSKIKITRDPQGAGLCSSGDDMTEQTVEVKKNEKVFLRLSTNIAGTPVLTKIEVYEKAPQSL